MYFSGCLSSLSSVAILHYSIEWARPSLPCICRPRVCRPSPRPDRSALESQLTRKLSLGRQNGWFRSAFKPKYIYIFLLKKYKLWGIMMMSKPLLCIGIKQLKILAFIFTFFVFTHKKFKSFLFYFNFYLWFQNILKLLKDDKAPTRSKTNIMAIMHNIPNVSNV